MEPSRLWSWWDSNKKGVVVGKEGGMLKARYWRRGISDIHCYDS
jgi:hypothetical protein